MRRSILFCVAVLVLAVAVSGAAAQGLAGLTDGLPLLGSLLPGRSSCGPNPCAPACPGPVLYVGYTSDPGNSTSFSADATGIGVGGVTKIRQSYAMEGLWLGAAQTVPVSENLGVMVTGWYLVPSGRNSTSDIIVGGATQNTTWSAKNEWWYVDGAFLYGGVTNGFSAVLGLRYDRFTTSFKSPNQVGIVLATDEANVISDGIIPLIGGQYSYTGSATILNLRVVGVPTLVGTAKYTQSATALGTAVDAKGNYNGGYFLEVFGEYGRKVYGNAEIGIFGRWNMARGVSDLNVDLVGLGLSDTFKFGVERNTWTVGGMFSMQFNLL